MNLMGEPKYFKTKQCSGGYQFYGISVYPDTYYAKSLPSEDAIEIVRKSLLDIVCSYTLIAKNELDEKVENVMFIISEKMFKGEIRLPEWDDLVAALKMHKFEYAYNHPCLWKCKKRLMFFDYVYSVIPWETLEGASAYEAMVKLDVFDDWRKVLDDPHEAPLKRVLDKYGNVVVMTSDDASLEEKRWAEGREMIFFMKNCVDYLTEVEIGPFNERCYKHINFLSDDPLYKDIEFFNHMATYFLYPKLWIELYAALYIGGYKF